MRAIYTGSRHWNDPHLVYAVLTGFQERFPDMVVVHGANPRGLDGMVDKLARRLGLEVEPHPAEWSVLGRAAGPIRNREMLDAGADVVVAFKDALEPGLRKGGTEHMMKIANLAGVLVAVFPAACTLVRGSGGYGYVPDASLAKLTHPSRVCTRYDAV